MIQSSTTPHLGSTLPSTQQMDAESSEGRVAHLNSFASIDLIEFNTIVKFFKIFYLSFRTYPNKATEGAITSDWNTTAKYYKWLFSI